MCRFWSRGLGVSKICVPWTWSCSFWFQADLQQLVRWQNVHDFVHQADLVILLELEIFLLELSQGRSTWGGAAVMNAVGLPSLHYQCGHQMLLMGVLHQRFCWTLKIAGTWYRQCIFFLVQSTVQPAAPSGACQNWRWSSKAKPKNQCSNLSLNSHCQLGWPWKT